MAIDERYIPITSLNQAFLDKDTGLPLANGKLWFYKDSGSRSQLKTVYQISGGPVDYQYVALENPVSLNSIGAVENASNDNVIIYALPYDEDGDLELYYVRCENSAGVEQWTRGAIPHIGESNDPTNDSYNTENALSNAQFSEYFLPNDEVELTVTGTGSLTIAPDWNVDYAVSGASSTIKLKRVPVAGTDTVPFSPSYYLEIEPGENVSTCSLRQRLNVNSGLWANKSLAITLTGRKIIGQSNQVSLKYSDGGATAQTLLSGFLDEDELKEIRGSATLADSNNASTSPNTYVDIFISIPTASRFALTNIQVVQVPSEDIGDTVPYQERSSNREKALMGDWYIPRLAMMPVRNYLVGWDFNLNPAQFGNPSIDVDASTNQGKYIWDQTICGRVGNDMTVARNAYTGGFQVTTGTDGGAFYMMQYLEGPDAKRLLANKLAVNINAYRSTVGDNVTMRVYLFGAQEAVTFPTLPTSIINMDADGTVELGAGGSGWFQITRGGLDEVVSTLTYEETSAKAILGIVDNVSDINNDGLDYHFNQWQIATDADITNFHKFAIVVTFVCPDTNQVITVDSISLQPGDIATRPLPQTKEEVLRECEYYYEMSYDDYDSYESNVGNNNPVYDGAHCVTQSAFGRRSGSSNYGTYALAEFSLMYRTVKRSINSAKPINFFNPKGGASTVDHAHLRVLEGPFPAPFRYVQKASINIDMDLQAANPTFILQGASKKESLYLADYSQGANITPAQDPLALSSKLEFHYVVDSRIGVV